MGYTLPLKKERSLAGILAFLSNIKDDPEHIRVYIWLPGVTHLASYQLHYLIR